MEKLIDQYGNSSNLDVRIKLHDQYSTNKKDWFLWLFEHYQIESGSSILELGCGDGTFWAKNEKRIPEDWKIVLSDFSSGMVVDAKQKLSNLSSARFEQIDVQSISYADNSFDVIIANFMLYHAPDRKQALHEIRRVLKPGGKLYAATIGEKHLMEFGMLLKEFDATLDYSSAESNAKAFGLENGADQLAPYFSEIKLELFPDGLEVSEVQPIIAYLLSTHTDIKNQLVGQKLKEFELFLIQKKKENDGYISITKASGFFEAQ
ncbi:class I SAM-dependent methyltransferase [Planococcus sp. N028]|uniref:Class I SAM-dependent methyltransferase n=1 Tax=Planococcus shixiaomingii TaxID=3058393 RepID=A0ABT8MY81_9BACL|nr:class I SAM-dependent methyltransferase [Planococcus sp. N028]MDN7240599.1 class I SAM-dependent methyltransferase [Planococcus sp. N028]